MKIDEHVFTCKECKGRWFRKDSIVAIDSTGEVIQSITEYTCTGCGTKIRKDEVGRESADGRADQEKNRGRK